MKIEYKAKDIILGSLSENDTWIARKLTTDHNTENEAEVNRILDQHPGEHKMNIFRGKISV